MSFILSLFTGTKPKSHRVTNYRRRLKEENPNKYKEYLIKQKDRCKRQREDLKKQLAKKKPASAAIDKKNHQLKQQRARQAKYLEGRMKSDNKQITFSKPQTRNSIETKKVYIREMQRLYRSKMTTQEKNWMKKKDRERKQSRRLNQKEKLQNESQEQFFKELRKIPKGMSALIGAARGLVKKGYSQKYLSSRLQINRMTLSAMQKLNKKN